MTASTLCPTVLPLLTRNATLPYYRGSQGVQGLKHSLSKNTVNRAPSPPPLETAIEAGSAKILLLKYQAAEVAHAKPASPGQVRSQGITTQMRLLRKPHSTQAASCMLVVARPCAGDGRPSPRPADLGTCWSGATRFSVVARHQSRPATDRVSPYKRLTTA